LVVLAAPSGAGKTTVAKALLARRNDLEFSVSATTRAPRGNEQEGRDYYFVSPHEFDQRLGRGEFIEWAQYAGNRYGTLKAEIERIKRKGHQALLEIEVQGAEQIRAKYPPPQSLAIFLLPPSGQELVQRLQRRGTEGQQVLRARLEQACEELKKAGAFDYAVINDDLDAAVREVSDVIDGRRAETRTEVHALVDRVLGEIENILKDF
jgi:guanylate kinase